MTLRCPPTCREPAAQAQRSVSRACVRACVHERRSLARCLQRKAQCARTAMPTTAWLRPSMKGPPGVPALVPTSQPYGVPPVTPMPTRELETVSCGQ
jgi:hypothetical protein